MTAKALKKGFTTGAAAAASVKAALISLLTCRHPDRVQVQFLTGETRVIDVHNIDSLSNICCRASVIKDAGDDPDITHKAEIGVTLTLKKGSPGITITGGQGVGKVTQPGLEVAVGEPAINPGPCQMIEEAVYQVYQQLAMPFCHHVHVEVFVPRGEELAKKTLNKRLGIFGGISILGTTGIVRPLSHDAYIATIRSGISVARAGGATDLVFTTGRRSERYAMEIFSELPPMAFIQTGDFFKAGIDAVLNENSKSVENSPSNGNGNRTDSRDSGAVPREKIHRITYTIFFGKAVKMALGFEHTHAAKSELTLKSLSKWALDITGNLELAGEIASANTARHAFSHIYPDYPELVSFVGGKIREVATAFARHAVNIRIIILDFDGCCAFDSGA